MQRPGFSLRVTATGQTGRQIALVTVETVPIGNAATSVDGYRMIAQRALDF